jgi:hypothetical protein
LIDNTRHSNIFDVRSFRGADCDTDHYLAVAKLRERILVSKVENIKTSVKENLGYQKLKHNKPWFDDECSKLTDQRKQAKL